jgi:hypothetical protein
LAYVYFENEPGRRAAAKVARYRQMLRAGSTAPPIAVMKYNAKKYLLLDGHHRLRAHRQRRFSGHRGYGGEPEPNRVMRLIAEHL